MKILNKIEFENNCWVGLVDSSEFNSSEENRIKAVTDLASITKGRLGFKITCNDCHSYLNSEESNCQGEDEPCHEFTQSLYKNRRKSLYNKLLTESAGKPSVPFEFVPCKVDQDLNIARIDNKYHKYGLKEDFNNFYTNCRNELTYIESCQYNNAYDVKDFKVIVGKVPWKVISHLRTHRAFSWLVESSRNKRYLNEVEFWYPSWWNKPTLNYFKACDDGIKSDLLNINNDIEFNLKSEEATMELSDRRLVLFAMAAWIEPNSWDNLFKVRGEDTGTQSITKIVVDNIKELITGKDETKI